MYRGVIKTNNTPKPSWLKFLEFPVTLFWNMVLRHSSDGGGKKEKLLWWDRYKELILRNEKL
jgi:hypothetical protein